MRSRPRLDQNHKEIVEALLGVGASVQSLASIGCGCPDLLISYRGRTLVMELKIEGGKLRPEQEKWIQNWNGEVVIARDVPSALKAIGVNRL